MVKKSVSPEFGTLGFNNFILSGGYIGLRAIFFYTLFTILYKLLKSKKGICKDKPSRTQLKKEKLTNFKANLFEWMMLFGILSFGVVKKHPFSWSLFVFTFLFCYFFFEFWFYSSHRFIHSKKLFFIHRPHHVSIITTPLSALNLSIFEKIINDTGMLIIPALLSHFIPLSFEGIIAYHFYNFCINVLGHSNLELLPKSLINSFFGKCFTTSTYHSIHHLKVHYNYGLFTTLFDRLFGTYDPHYQKTVNKIIAMGPQTQKNLTFKGVGENKQK